MDCETKAKLFFPMFVSRVRLHKKLMPCKFIAIVLDIAAGSDLSDDDVILSSRIQKHLLMYI